MKNKNLVGDIVEVEKVKSKGSIKGPTVKKQKSTKELLIEFMKEQRTFNTRIEKRIDNIDQRLNKIENRLDNIVKLNNLKE